MNFVFPVVANNSVEENEFSTWGFADFSLVRAGVPCQSSSVLDSLNHFFKFLSKMSKKCRYGVTNYVKIFD